LRSSSSSYSRSSSAGIRSSSADSCAFDATTGGPAPPPGAAAAAAAMAGGRAAAAPRGAVGCGCSRIGQGAGRGRKPRRGGLPGFAAAAALLAQRLCPARAAAAAAGARASPLGPPCYSACCLISCCCFAARCGLETAETARCRSGLNVASYSYTGVCWKPEISILPVDSHHHRQATAPSGATRTARRTAPGGARQHPKAAGREVCGTAAACRRPCRLPSERLQLDGGKHTRAPMPMECSGAQPMRVLGRLWSPVVQLCSWAETRAAGHVRCAPIMPTSALPTIHVVASLPRLVAEVLVGRESNKGLTAGDRHRVGGRSCGGPKRLAAEHQQAGGETTSSTVCSLHDVRTLVPAAIPIRVVKGGAPGAPVFVVKRRGREGGVTQCGRQPLHASHHPTLLTSTQQGTLCLAAKGASSRRRTPLRRSRKRHRAARRAVHLSSLAALASRHTILSLVARSGSPPLRKLRTPARQLDPLGREECKPCSSAGPPRVRLARPCNRAAGKPLGGERADCPERPPFLARAAAAGSITRRSRRGVAVKVRRSRARRAVAA
jgi:hypothetical protein